MNARAWRSIGAVLILAGCGSSAPEVSNTGYTGTWSRGTDRVTSFISIRSDGAGYRFRWQRIAIDGKSRVTCGWDGRCEEFVDGAKTSDYRFTTSIDPDTEHVIVRCEGMVFAPEELEIEYVDELIVSPDGLTLTAFTLERDGQVFEGEYRPKHVFRKIDDRVADPAEGSRDGG